MVDLHDTLGTAFLYLDAFEIQYWTMLATNFWRESGYGQVEGGSNSGLGTAGIESKGGADHPHRVQVDEPVVVELLDGVEGVNGYACVGGRSTIQVSNGC